MPTVRRRRSTRQCRSPRNIGRIHASTSRDPGGNPSSLLAVQPMSKRTAEKSSSCSSRDRKRSVSANLTNRRICFLVSGESNQCSWIPSMPVASAESAPNSPCESGGPRKRTRRLVRLRSIAPSIGSTLVCGRRSTSISATSPGFPLSGNQHTFVSKPRRPARSFTFSTAAPIATNTHDAAVLGGGPPSLIAPQPHPPTGMFELDFAPVVRGWRQRRRLDERQEFSRIQTRHTRAPAAGTHCRGRVVAPTNSAEAICLSHVRSNSGALAVSEYTILGAAPN